MSNQQSKSPVVAPVEVKLLTTKQAADTLQISERSVFNLLKAGDIPSVKIGASLRIRVADLDDFIKVGVVRIARTTKQPSVDELASFAADLTAGKTTLDPEFAAALAQIVTAHRGHVLGELTNLKQVRKQRDAALRLSDGYIKELLRKDRAGEKWTPDEKRAVHFMSAAVLAFNVALAKEEAA